MISTLIERFKKLYQKPFIQQAIDTTIIGFMDTWLAPRGWMIIAIPAEEPKKEQAPVTSIKDVQGDN
jgi:hypothetical protein